MEHWREYDVQATEVKPWLGDAEKRTAVIITRPSSVSEMESLLNAAHVFEDECKRQLTKLQQMSSHCQQMFNQSSTLRRIGRFAQSMERRPRHGSPAARAPDVRAIPGLFFRLSLASLIFFSIRSFRIRNSSKDVNFPSIKSKCELVNLIVEIILKTYAKFNFTCQSLFHVAIQLFINFCHS